MSDIVISNPQSLIELAIEKGAGIEQLKELMDLKERYDAGEAKKVFFASMTLFQSECPVLNKTKKVSFNNTEYSYTPLGSIAGQIKEIVDKCGFSYRWTIKDDEKIINVTCIVSHKDGHSESTTMSGNLDATGSKNAIQQRGSTVTYLQRYTLIGALGITTADDDNDGKGTTINKPESQQSDDLMVEIEEKINGFKTKTGLVNWVNNNEGYWNLEGFQQLVKTKSATFPKK